MVELAVVDALEDALVVDRTAEVVALDVVDVLGDVVVTVQVDVDQHVLTAVELVRLVVPHALDVLVRALEAVHLDVADVVEYVQDVVVLA